MSVLFIKKKTNKETDKPNKPKLWLLRIIRFELFLIYEPLIKQDTKDKSNSNM